jgi:predicted nucleotide-binding protein
MALNPENIKFLLQQLRNASSNAFYGIVSQIFSYLNEEVKDNPVFAKYEGERERWEQWPNTDEVSFSRGQWSLPTTLEDTKSLAYSIYKTISIKGQKELDQFGFRVFRKNNTSENLREVNATFLGYFIQALEDIVNANPEKSSEQPKPVDGGTAFIIHGHDALLKTEVQLLMHRAGVQSVVLHEMPDRGRTIIEKLVDETKSAGYAIALLTPDDLTDGGEGRARQNVIMEIGYFLGKLGKERLRMIVKDGVEVPSDLQGILYEKHDANGAWKMKLLKEMRAVGIFVDLTSVVDLL